MTELKVAGMSCQHCVKSVTQAIQSLDPQARVEVDLGAGRVKVDSALAPAALARAIDDAGYTVEAI
jgi:copper chaperone